MLLLLEILRCDSSVVALVLEHGPNVDSSIDITTPECSSASALVGQSRIRVVAHPNTMDLVAVPLSSGNKLALTVTAHLRGQVL